MDRTYKSFEDPGHGWLEVPMSDLFELGIADAISPYSYFDKETSLAYLEEDLDASNFVASARAAGWVLTFDSHYRENIWIRGLPSYPAGDDWKARAYGGAA